MASKEAPVEELLTRVGGATVPREQAEIYTRMNEKVESFFGDPVIDRINATFRVSNERFLLLRTEALSAAFVDTVRQQHPDPEEATTAAHSMLYDIAYSIGHSDADFLSRKLDVTDSKELLSCGPLFFAYTGWANVTILPGAVLTSDSNFFLPFRHLNAEAEANISNNRKSDRPSCVMNAGYASGWTSRAFHIRLSVTELKCQSIGDDHCHFIIAPIEKLQSHIAEFGKKFVEPTRYEIYEFYGRQRMLHELAERERQSMTIFQNSTDAFILADQNGVIAHVNTAARSLFRAERARHLVGKNLRDIGVDPSLVRELADHARVPPPASSHVNHPIVNSDSASVSMDSDTSIDSLDGGTPRHPAAPPPSWIEVVAKRVDGTTFDADISVGPFRMGPQSQLMLTIRDVSKDKEAQRQLLLASEAAKEASRMKSDFLAMFSHEVRTPMNGVVGMASVLLESDLSVDQRRNVELIQRSAQSLIDLLGNILDMTSLEAGKLRVFEADFDLTQLIHDVADLYRPQAQRKRLDLRTSIAHDIPERVHSDPNRLRQILSNLIQNAIKFTTRGSVDITVRVSQTQPELVAAPVEEEEEEDGTGRKRKSAEDEANGHGGARKRRSQDPEVGENRMDEEANVTWLLFSVRDTGSGVPEADLPTIFHPYEQGSGNELNSSGISGSGLGLTICKQLVEALGGQITLESTLGQFTDIKFSVPFKSVKSAHVSFTSVRCLVVTDSGDDSDLLTLLRSLHVDVIAVRSSVAQAASFLDAHRFNVTTILPFDVCIIDLPDLRSTLVDVGARPSLGRLPVVCLRRRPEDADISATESFVHLLDDTPTPKSIECALQWALTFRPDARPLAQTSSSGSLSLAPLTLEPFVLVVEDHPVNQMLMTAILRKLHCRHNIAGTGEEAVRLAEANTYDLILMDCSLPGMDGVQTTRVIRAGEVARGKKKVPIVALTGDGFAETTVKCLEGGMNAVLIKPIQVKDMQAVLDSFVTAQR